MIYLTEGEIEEAQIENIGFCVACGEEREMTEPDAKNYKCDSCDEMKVFGIDELLLNGKISIISSTPLRDSLIEGEKNDEAQN